MEKACDLWIEGSASADDQLHAPAQQSSHAAKDQAIRHTVLNAQQPRQRLVQSTKTAGALSKSHRPFNDARPQQTDVLSFSAYPPIDHFK
jgi:hypothetical protein